MDDIIEEFLAESHENLDRLDREFVELESDPTSVDLLASIFRTIHTIKGTAGFFGFSHLEQVSHAGENLLSLLRDGELSLTTETTNALLGMVDAIRAMLDIVADSGVDGDDDWAQLTGELRRLADPAAAPAEADADTEAVTETVTETATDTDETTDTDAATDTETATATETVTATEAVTEDRDEPEPAPAEPTAPTAAATDAGDEAHPHQASRSETSIRVDVELLDRLMNLVGELVLARNQVLQYHVSQGDPVFQGTSQQLDLITTELQEGVMQTRMQPIGNVWTKFPRIVRDLSTSLEKSVELEMIGKETELDKTLIEAIKDPLTHIVRNSVDHGIEAPAERLAAGKPETGTLRLRAFHEGGQVIIEISDDGKGLDLERIRDKAISTGILSEERARNLTDRDTAHLIFHPGFSTAEKVTNVSGRGVGMDVVKTNVEKIGGTLDLQTVPGQGTTLTIKIPLTLAIIPALIIACNDNRYLIPQVNLVEVLHIEPDSGSEIERVGDAEVFRLRGTLLPIVHLRRILGLPEATATGERVLDEADAGPDEDPATAVDASGAADERDAGGWSIVVLQADGRQFGLVVDRISDTEEIVVKPLSPHLKNIDAFAGTTIMGDGAVALILDAIGIARVSGVVSEIDSGVPLPDADAAADERRGRVQTVLVARVGTDRIAIPLGLVSRLEELPADQVERAAGRDVIQYRGRLLNLVNLRDVLHKEPAPEDLVGEPPDSLRVLVYESDDQVYGFLVDEILDVFDTDLSDAEPASVPGLSVSGVIGRRVTDLIDIDDVIRIADPRPAGALA